MELTGVERHYRRGFTLGPINLVIETGLTFLIGRNGAGKSTLFRLLAGDDAPSAGSLNWTTSDRRARIGYLPQDPLLPALSNIGDYLYHAAWLHRVPREDRNTAIERVADLTNLTDRLPQRIGKLSGGTQRRVAIAATIIHSPEFVLLDEPSSGLDPAQRVQLRAVIARMALDRAVVVSTHLIEDLQRQTDSTVVVLRDGRLIHQGPVSALEGSGASDDTVETAITRLMGESG
ncbi:ATP-binding cassette domain-containing protein [Nakamurella sp. A5-74]|uniref:ATP-binding cassette domain-containing protein n=1 Tax=Nakamurella sp. A5-74 TaxID=3158264 RepID=A0AAU8DMA9_9ACTN